MRLSWKGGESKEGGRYLLWISGTGTEELPVYKNPITATTDTVNYGEQKIH